MEYVGLSWIIIVISNLTRIKIMKTANIYISIYLWTLFFSGRVNSKSARNANRSVPINRNL